MSNVTGATGSKKGGLNEQASSRSRNGRQIRNVLSNQIIGKAQAVPEPPSADTNSDTCCLGTNFISLAYTNIAAAVYPYNVAYNQIENITIFSGPTSYDYPNGTTYILIFVNSCIMAQRYNIS